MVFLSEPDERRLWFVIIAILGTSALLVLSSLQFPWYTATYYVGTAEYQGTFDFEEAVVQLFSNGREGTAYTGPYDDSPFANLMESVQVFVALGIVGMGAFGALLAAYYYGHLASTRWIKVSWIVGFVCMILGITWFSLRAGYAGAEEIAVQIAAHPQLGGAQLGTPEPTFWGEQPYANGELVSAPGVGWLLAILAVVNYAAGTLLLYRFPEPDADTSDFEVADDEDDLPAMESVEVETARLA